MAQGLGREVKEQTQGKECIDKKASVKSVRCSDGKVMGSRRIFAPQFKLQVLDSYRKDEDCKGNQRATARKYGIHRRQIQKWLQVEASLRTSVEVSPASEPTALNLSADAARQRDDSGESRQAACQRGGELPSSCNEHTDTELLVKLEVADHEDLHLKEEQVYEDNMEVHNTDEALDFTCAALSKRRSFSLQFKLEVLDAFHADRMCHGNQRATARKFGINRRQVQKWLGQEAELRGEAAFRGGLYRQRLGRWMDLDENKKAEENVPTANPVESDDSVIRDSDQCWDLSGKKRRLEVETIDTVYSKRRAVDQTVLQSRGEIMNENYDVSSSANAGRDVLYSDVQETALCLVKGKSEERPEVTSSIDTRITYEPQIVPPSYHPHMIPLVLPAPSYDLYSGLHCRHHYMHHLHPPKWFTREPELCQDFGSIRAFNMFRLFFLIYGFATLSDHTLSELCGVIVLRKDCINFLAVEVEEDRPMQQGHSHVAESPTAIKQRYEDTAISIFKEQQQELKSSRGFLSYGNSRRTVEYSNFGNGSVVVHKPGPSPVLAKSVESQHSSRELGWGRFPASLARAMLVAHYDTVPVSDSGEPVDDFFKFRQHFPKIS